MVTFQLQYGVSMYEQCECNIPLLVQLPMCFKQIVKLYKDKTLSS